LRALLNYDVYFIDSGVFSSRLRLIDYFLKIIRTWALLRDRPSDVVWIAAPPVVLIYVCFLFRAVSRRRFMIVIDCHNGTFLRPWGRFPWLGVLLQGADQCVVHTPYARTFLEQRHVAAENISVLEDLPPQPQCSSKVGDRRSHIDGPYVVIPTSFRSDQPIDVFAELARRLDGFTVVVTGDHQRRDAQTHLRDAPTNLILTGFLETPVFDALLRGAEALVGLTLRDNAIVSVAAEGIGFNVPLVLSDTPTLRAHFPKGAVFVDTKSPQSVADGVKLAIQAKRDLQRQLAELRVDRVAICELQAGRLLDKLSHGANSRPSRAGAAAKSPVDCALAASRKSRPGPGRRYGEVGASPRPARDWTS
jgi:glycosyltransferase involved in cell wall biosynthesis